MNAAIWARVSTGEQETANQLDVLRRWAQHRELEVVREFELHESAFNGAHHAELDNVLQGARTGEFDVLLVWALDRLSREGIEAMMKLLRQFHENGVAVWSHEEPWANTSDPHMRDLLVAMFAWMARMESARRSERIKAALARRRDQGLPVGRKSGAKDRRKRRTSGYYARYAKTKVR